MKHEARYKINSIAIGMTSSVTDDVSELLESELLEEGDVSELLEDDMIERS